MECRYCGESLVEVQSDQAVGFDPEFDTADITVLACGACEAYGIKKPAYGSVMGVIATADLRRNRRTLQHQLSKKIGWRVSNDVKERLMQKMRFHTVEQLNPMNWTESDCERMSDLLEYDDWLNAEPQTVTDQILEAAEFGLIRHGGVGKWFARRNSHLSFSNRDVKVLILNSVLTVKKSFDDDIAYIDEE